MPKITKIIARQILDSRATPTIETKVTLDNGIEGIDSVPSGASTGKDEALELRDNNPAVYMGKSVLNAVNNVNNIIAPRLIGADVENQQEIDKLLIDLDGTPNKGKLGANSILSVSMSTVRAAATTNNLPLYKYIRDIAERMVIKLSPLSVPIPLFNVINGGKHGAGNLNIQEFMIIPASNKTYHEALQIGVEIYHKLKETLIFRNAVASVGDEGGFAPNLSTNIDALEAIAEAIRNSNYRLGVDVFLGLDLAASVFLKNGRYQLIDRAQAYSPDEFIEYLTILQDEYKMLLFEDPFGEEEWDTWVKFTSKLGDKVFVVGDDLLVTNPKKLDQAIKTHACNSILVKLNQIGTFTQTLEVVKNALAAGFKNIVSHRSGETTDTFVSDLAVGLSADYVKFGAPARGERVVKYNRLLEIEEELSQKS
ncbi:phosphopyruvate hydratase [Candidatus Gottesmanbacteria bacterium]|nr:phosphopyruvate hydratase [Candidatus Gottesmanbacteria bacterium]